MSEENDQESVEEKAGGTSVLLMIAVLVGGILIGAGGYFGISMFMAPSADHDAEIEVVEEVVEEAPVEPEEEMSYIEIKRMPAAILAKDGTVMGYVFLDLKVEVPADRDPAYVQVRLPRIQSAMLKDIATHGVTVPGKPGVIDYDGLNRRFTKVANEVVGGNRIKSVFVFRAIRS